MPGPFPGMDPWLEDEEVFPDLHDSLIVLMKESLNVALPQGYIAISRHLVWPEEARRHAHVFLVPDRPESHEANVAKSPLTGLIPLGKEACLEDREEPYLEILTTKDRRLVTAVEILSRSNKKPGNKGREAYKAKQEEFRQAGANVVEIDLLRDGSHVTMVSEARLRRKAGAFDYHVSVMVAGRPNVFYGASIRLADRLPAIGIPLDAGVPPVTLDLQPLLDRIYDGGRYAFVADYRQPPDPPLTPEQQTWAEGVLKAKGLLPGPNEG